MSAWPKLSVGRNFFGNAIAMQKHRWPACNRAIAHLPFKLVGLHAPVTWIVNALHAREAIGEPPQKRQRHANQDEQHQPRPYGVKPSEKLRAHGLKTSRAELTIQRSSQGVRCNDVGCNESSSYPRAIECATPKTVALTATLKDTSDAVACASTVGLPAVGPVAINAET